MTHVEVFGLSHDRRSGVWAADVIRRGKPDVVCFEAWAEFMKLFDMFESRRIDMISEDSQWKEVLPLMKWYWNFAMSLLEKEPIVRAAREVGAEPIAIDVSIRERMTQEGQIRQLRKKDSSFKMRLWFAHKIFQNFSSFAARPFIRFPSLMNSLVGEAYFKTARRLWDALLPESQWWGLGRERYMAQKVAETWSKRESPKIYVFVGTTHKWSLQALIKAHKVIAITRDTNLRSVKLIGKLGFSRERHLRESGIQDGKRYGLLYYGMLRTEFSSEQH